MKKTIALAVASTSLLLAGSVSAQQFADRGTLSFAGDRLFGLYRTHLEVDPDDDFGGVDVDGTEIGLLWQANHLTPYTVPRLSVDYFVIDHLSVGGSIGYSSGSWDDGDNDYDGSSFLFAPRVGGAWMFNDWAGIWPRGGLSYYALTDGAAGLGGNTDASVLALNVEAAFVLSPSEGFAFTVGPAFDLGLVGDWDPPGRADGDLNMYGIGFLTIGILGYLNL